MLVALLCRQAKTLTPKLRLAFPYGGAQKAQDVALSPHIKGIDFLRSTLPLARLSCKESQRPMWASIKPLKFTEGDETCKISASIFNVNMFKSSCFIILQRHLPALGTWSCCYSWGYPLAARRHWSAAVHRGGWGQDPHPRRSRTSATEGQSRRCLEDFWRDSRPPRSRTSPGHTEFFICC